MIFITIVVIVVLIMIVIRCAGTGTATYYQRQTLSASKPNRIVTHSSLGKNIIVVMVIIDVVVIIMAKDDSDYKCRGQGSARKVLNHSLLAARPYPANIPLKYLQKHSIFCQ